MPIRTIPLEGMRDDVLGVFMSKVIFGYAAASPAAGIDIVVAAQATFQLFTLKAGTLVLNAFTRVITAWTASVTLTLGDGNQAAGFFGSAAIAPATAVPTGIMKAADQASGAYAGGINYPADDTIDVVVAGATPVAGRSELYLLCSLMPLAAVP